jgi:uncharacterized protein
MKIKNLCISLIILSVFLAACSSAEKKTDKAVKSDKMKDGPGKIYWDDKSLKGEGNFKNFQKDGKWTLYHKGIKAKLAEGNYLNDTQSGLWTYYNKNGSKNSEGSFEDNQKTGKWTGFYESGEKMWVANYNIINTESGKIGVLDGIKTTYFITGALKQEEEYSKGVKKNKHQEYYDNGKLKETSYFLNDKHNGKCTVFWENGKVKEHGNYKDDLRVNNWQFFYESGQLIATGNFEIKQLSIKGEEQSVTATDGKWQYFSKEGLLQKEGEFDKGKETGFWKYYSYQNNAKKQLKMELTLKGGMAVGEGKLYDNGLLTGSGNMTGTVKGIYKKYVAGKETEEESYMDTPPDNLKANITYKWTGNWQLPKRNGAWTEYYPGSDNKKIDAVFMMDKLSGKYKEYFQNGKIKAEGEYLNGKKNGMWKVYNQNGNLNEEESGRWMMDKKSKVQ